MSEQIHQLDPDGDILLVVNRSSSMTKHSNYDLQGEKVRPADSASGTTQIANSLSDHVNELEDADLPIERLSQIPAGHSVDAAVKCSSSITEAEPTPVARFQVSSRHLALASPVFKEAVQSRVSQTHVSREQSFEEVQLSNDDPDALLVLLHLIHGQFRQIPREVDLGTLTQIAILVDKYELLETTNLLAHGWLSGAKDSIPSELNDNLLPWIYIAEVFREEDISQELRKVAVFRSKGLLEAQGLPIPGQILNEIESSRKATLSEIFDYLEQTRERLLCQRICLQSIECDGMALGCLLKGLKALGILETPQPPYEDFSVTEVLGGLKDIELPRYCKTRRGRVMRSWESESCEGLKRPLIAKIQELENRFGVDMSSDYVESLG